MQVFPFADFLSRSTDIALADTTLAKTLRLLPSLAVTGPWIAGGSVRRTMMREGLNSDFDYFFADASQFASFQSDMKARGFIEKRQTEHHVHFHGPVHPENEPSRDIDVQAIKFAYYSDAPAVIDSFDFTICQTAFDGSNLTVGDFTLWDLARKRLAVHKLTYPLSSMRRTLKYARQGFRVCDGCLTTLLKATSVQPELLNTLNIAYVD